MPVLQDTDQKQTVNYIIKLAVTGGLLFLIFRSVDTEDAFAALAAVSPWYLLMTLLLQVVSIAVAASRWFLIMSRIGFTHPCSFYMKSYLTQK